MNSPTPRMWEVWHARFNYDRNKGYKYRPVIVVGMQDDGMLSGRDIAALSAVLASL